MSDPDTVNENAVHFNTSIGIDNRVEDFSCSRSSDNTAKNLGIQNSVFDKTYLEMSRLRPCDRKMKTFSCTTVGRLLPQNTEVVTGTIRIHSLMFQ